MSKSMFHKGRQCGKIFAVGCTAPLSSQGDAFNVLLCLISMVPEGILANVTSVETIYLLRYICVRFLGGISWQCQLRQTCSLVYLCI